MSTVLSSPKVVADDTTLPVLDPGRGRTKTGRLWCYAVDNRPWSGPGHPAAAYAYIEDSKGKHPATHLKGFRGLLQVDGYAGFGGLVAGAAHDAPTLAFYWAQWLLFSNDTSVGVGGLRWSRRDWWRRGKSECEQQILPRGEEQVGGDCRQNGNGEALRSARSAHSKYDGKATIGAEGIVPR